MASAVGRSAQPMARSGAQTPTPAPHSLSFLRQPVCSRFVLGKASGFALGGSRAQASNVALGGTHTAGRSTSRMGESRGKTTAGSRSWPACTASNTPMDVAAGRPVGASSDPSMRAGCSARQALETSASPSSEKSGTHTILRCPESEFSADAVRILSRRRWHEPNSTPLPNTGSNRFGCSVSEQPAIGS